MQPRNEKTKKNTRVLEGIAQYIMIKIIIIIIIVIIIIIIITIN